MALKQTPRQSLKASDEGSLRFYVKKAGKDTKLILQGTLGVTRHLRHPLCIDRIRVSSELQLLFMTVQNEIVF
jgi:hypothetical protein